MTYSCQEKYADMLRKMIRRKCIAITFEKRLVKNAILKEIFKTIEIDRSRHLLVQSQQWNHQNNKWHLLKVNNKDIHNVVLKYLLLTLNRFDTLFWCIHC